MHVIYFKNWFSGSKDVFFLEIVWDIKLPSLVSTFLKRCCRYLACLSLTMIISVFSLWALLQVIELVYVSIALMMFVPRYVQSYIFYNRCIHLVVFCFPLFYISMDFPFNLGQHCGGRQAIDFRPTGLTGTRISPSRWGFAAGCDKAQSIGWNLRAHLLANQSET